MKHRLSIVLTLILISACGPTTVALDNAGGVPIEGPLEGMMFVQLPGGVTQIGSVASEIGRRDDEDYDLVSVSPFEIMTTEVTQRMWEGVMGSLPGCMMMSIHQFGNDFPVIEASYCQVLEFVEKLNVMDPVYEYRIPTESEWEYACRAGSNSRFFWGDSDNEAIASVHCWYSENACDSLHVVAQLEPNAWGLYDMAGNVEECVYVDLDQGYYSILKGGSYMSEISGLRSARRRIEEPCGGGTIGFRLVRVKRDDY